MTTESAVATTTVRAFQYAHAYGFTLLDARLPEPEELMRFVAEYRPHALFGGRGGESLDLPHLNWRDLEDLFNRPATHSFPGCSNSAWLVTPEEEARIRAIETARAAAEIIQQAEATSAEDARIALITAAATRTGTAQVVETWMEDCYQSDCSFDTCARMVRPDGSAFISRAHCY